MSSTTELLVVRDVDVRRGERSLIRGLSFRLAAGTRALLAGPNGSGKTSFLRILAGLAPCTAGSIEFDGCAVDRMQPEQRADFAYRGHLDGLKKELSVRENLAFYAALRGGKRGFEGILGELGLTELAGRQVRYLSAGQRRRAGLAALRLGNARLWILDEPMTNLDTDGRAVVARWVDEHTAAGGIAVVATHQPQDLAGPGTTLVEL